ncbi:hypothetical protein WJS89_11820 [Sphingomicrobium sp. XHP0235]|uniref:hypothetical protein n=1 Tax=Sphingomicrobium aquimarinum TaxID=3133971 RepID=UPI0031FF1C60
MMTTRLPKALLCTTLLFGATAALMEPGIALAQDRSISETKHASERRIEGFGDLSYSGDPVVDHLELYGSVEVGLF